MAVFLDSAPGLTKLRALAPLPPLGEKSGSGWQKILEVMGNNAFTQIIIYQYSRINKDKDKDNIHRQRQRKRQCVTKPL